MAVSRRSFLIGTGALLAAAGLPAWAINELHRHGEPTVLAQQLFGRSGTGEVDQVVHLVNRITFGANRAELDHARQLRFDGYLADQLHPETVDDSAMDARLAGFTTLGLSGSQLLAAEPQTVQKELRQATMLRALYSRRQLQEVLVDFWSNHFNIYIGKDQCRFFKTVDDRDVIRPHVLGNFRDLLGASAKSPAMLVYLDNRFNNKRAPNENYGRELMELHTIGVDGGYTEADVADVARCFTGWTIRDGAFAFVAQQHDDSAKTVLGTAIPAKAGVADGERVLDLLANHPSTARFIVTKLCRRFVNDAPPQSLVDKLVNVWSSTSGDLRQVMQALLTSSEFAAAGDQKFRHPFEYVAAAARALQVETDGQALVQQCAVIDRPIYGAFMPSGYPDVAAAWMNTSGLVNRWRFGLALAAGHLNGVPVDLTHFDDGKSTPRQVADRLVAALLPGATAAQLVEHLVPLLSGTQAKQRKQRLQVATGLLLAAPIFQWR